MNKEKLIENWDSLKDETKTKILALADKEIKEDYFVPKMGETFWAGYITSNGNCSASRYIYNGDNFYEKYLVEVGDCFRTQEEGIFAKNCDYYTKRFATYVNRHNEKFDWSDIEQPKYSAYYECNDYCDNYIQFSVNYKMKLQGVVYASSQEILKNAIADISEENFLKYVMKIDEGGASWESKAKD